MLVSGIQSSIGHLYNLQSDHPYASNTHLTASLYFCLTGICLSKIKQTISNWRKRSLKSGGKIVNELETTKRVKNRLENIFLNHDSINSKLFPSKENPSFLSPSSSSIFFYSTFSYTNVS